MSKPVVASITLFNAVSQWNDWFTGAFFVRNPNLKPLATVLQDMLTKQAAIADALKQKSGSYAMLDKLTITGLNADGNDCTINNSSIIPLPICSEAFCKRYNYRFDKRVKETKQ